MARQNARRTLGNRIAPPRFLVYFALLIIAGAVTLSAGQQQARLFMIGFDAATCLFLLSLAPLLRETSPAAMARHAGDNDANRGWLLASALALSGTIMVVVAGELGTASTQAPGAVPLILATLALTWLSGNCIFALHYAHIYYSARGDGDGYARGLEFPDDDRPDYLDFLNFALVLGMTFQTADITITSKRMRRISTLHCLAAFVFNLGILAFSINILAAK